MMTKHIGTRVWRLLIAEYWPSLIFRRLETDIGSILTIERGRGRCLASDVAFGLGISLRKGRR